MDAIIFDPQFSIGGTDRSGFIASLKISVKRDVKERMRSGQQGWKEKLPGVKEYDVEVEWEKDLELSTLDKALWDAWEAGDPIAWSGQLKPGGPTADNPTFSGQVIVPDHEVGGKVGDLHQHTSTFQGTGAIVRAEA